MSAVPLHQPHHGHIPDCRCAATPTHGTGPAASVQVIQSTDHAVELAGLLRWFIVGSRAPASGARRTPAKAHISGSGRGWRHGRGPGSCAAAPGRGGGGARGVDALRTANSGSARYVSSRPHTPGRSRCVPGTARIFGRFKPLDNHRSPFQESPSDRWLRVSQTVCNRCTGDRMATASSHIPTDPTPAAGRKRKSDTPAPVST